MPALLKKVGTITEKGQVTVPKSVRDALGLGYGGRIAFYVDENGRVSLERETEDEEDPVIDSFLHFLTRDMLANPHHVGDIPDALLARISALTAGMTVDPDDPIEGAVDL